METKICPVCSVQHSDMRHESTTSLTLCDIHHTELRSGLVALVAARSAVSIENADRTGSYAIVSLALWKEAFGEPPPKSRIVLCTDEVVKSVAEAIAASKTEKTLH